VAVLVPVPGQEQVGVDERLVAALGNAEVDSDDAVLLLAGLAAPLALHARGVLALLDRSGLVDDADGPQVLCGQTVQGVGDVALQDVAGPLEGPEVVLEELLEGAHGDSGVEGDGLAGLAVEVGEQAAAVDA